jgi:predicted phosphohydrolase
MGLRIVCLSDTHDRHDQIAVPDGDVLLHAGDFTKRGRAEEVERFAAFLRALPHRHKVIVPGNHDFLCEREPARARELLADVHYLCDEGVTLDGLRVWGSPWQPWFHDWAFNLPRGDALAAKWALAPEDVDVLVTHTPPHGVLDRCWDGREVGCEALLAALPRIRPRLHVFGHIHEAAGVALRGPTLHVNAASCDLSYRPTQPAVVVEWDGAQMRHVAGGVGTG